MISIKDLKESDLFKGLNRKELKLLIKHFTEKNFQTGEVVFSYGGLAQNLYILLEGGMTHGIKAKGEIDITVYSVRENRQAFGLSSLIKPYQNNVSAACDKRTRVLCIDGEILSILIETYYET